MSNNPSNTTLNQEVIEQIRKSITIAQERGDTKTTVALFKKLGQTYLDAGAAPEALTEFNEAIKLVANGDEKEIFSQMLGLRGLALKLIGNYSQALQSFRKSHAVASEINHPGLTCDSLIQIAALHSDMEKFAEANSALEDAQQIAVGHKDKVREMRLLGLLGDNSLKQADLAKASSYFQMAYEAAHDLDNTSAECSFITKQGNVALLEGVVERAIEKYERALKLASALADRNAEINILGGLFRAHAMAGELRPAQVYAEQVIQLCAEIEHTEAELANILTFVAYLIKQEQFDRVYIHLERGLQLVRQQTDLGMQMELLNLEGQAYANQEKYDAALASWNAALTLAANLQDEVFMARLYARMAAIFAETGDIEKSIDCAEKALELAKLIGDTKLVAEQYILLTFNFRDGSQMDKAKQACQLAIETYESIGEGDMVTYAQTLLADLGI
jgi:tetratricopeptide (TPR) repeat protein